MYVNNPGEKILNFTISSFAVILLFFLISLRFDFFYDINDDLLIRDILSGIYTGTPEAHTNQLLIPLSALLSFMYRLLPSVPVYGIFLCFCIIISLWLIFCRVLTFFKNIKSKIVAMVVFSLWVMGMFAWEIIFIQYTVVAGLLAGTAVFLIASLPHSGYDMGTGTAGKSGYGRGALIATAAGRPDGKEFWKKNTPALLCFMLSFLLRQEMALISSPFLVLACIFHWIGEYEEQQEERTGFEKGGIIGDILCKDNLVKYPAFIFGVIILMCGAMFVDNMAYGSEGWQKFRRFFDARTLVYDYTWYPEYEKTQEFYNQKGISEEQYELINNYNFGLDQTIDENVLEEIADYNEKDKHLGGVRGRVKNIIHGIFKSPFQGNHITFGSFLAVIYILFFVLSALQGEKKKYGIKIAMTVITGIFCRGYLFWIDRAVDRVLHPLYIIEFLLILALLITRLYDRPLWNPEQYYRRAVVAVFIILSLLLMPERLGAIGNEIAIREEFLEKQMELEEYTKKSKGKYYYLDVYSTVRFMDKIFHNYKNEKRNYDYAGGWIYHSPLQEKVGIEAVGGNKGDQFLLDEALLTDTIYFIAEQSRDISFIENYYGTKGIDVDIQRIDILTRSEDPFIVYKISRQ